MNSIDLSLRSQQIKRKEVNIMDKRIFYDVREVSEMLGVSSGCAYRIIRKLNKELSSQGYIVIAGKVSKAYFNQHYYGLASV